MDDRTQTRPLDTIIDAARRPVSRRGMLKRLGAAGLAASTLGALDSLAWAPDRVTQVSAQGYPAIQFDLGAYVPPARQVDGVAMAMPPVYTVFLTAQIARRGAPTRDDQQVLAGAIDGIEALYPFHPAGVFTHIAYGLPYFRRLPQGLVAAHLPVFRATGQAVLQEATPGPTDVSPLNPGVAKGTFNVPVRIEANDVLITLRGDDLTHLTDVARWLQGSNHLNGRAFASPAFDGLFRFTSLRVMFVQMGLPRRVAEQYALPYAGRVNPQSPMWMGFFSQQATGFGPAEIATFQGNASARFVGMLQPDGSARTVNTSDYFLNGAIQVLAHDILDLAAWYADDHPYADRVQAMFRSNPAPHAGYADQYADGGGPAALPNVVPPKRADGFSEAQSEAATNHRIGHVPALQRVTRAPDGTIVPQRIDGPGFDAMDVPGGAPQPKLQFSAFVPSAQNFAKARLNAAAPDLSPSQVPAAHNGIELFITATRRQNFLCPPRAHRAFPLLELA